ncbi:proteasome assembly chaperone 3 [Citrus sinensis]|uniref:Proteasome assembly chaperone 3 n=1 Tax=Citrus sinensis TaxID=2711 RepID=A0ACB8MYT8_CITSI|nr:proteasome assembly chaperone 3 [Citrus sinensis]
MSVLEQNFPVVQKKLSVDLKCHLAYSYKIGLCDLSWGDCFVSVVFALSGVSWLTIGHCNSNRNNGDDPACQICFFIARKDADISVHPTFSVSVIFGKRDEPMLVACARQLIEHISSSGTSQPLVLSLGLKDHSAETLKGIVSAVTENRLW